MCFCLRFPTTECVLQVRFWVRPTHPLQTIIVVVIFGLFNHLRYQTTPCLTHQWRFCKWSWKHIFLIYCLYVEWKLCARICCLLTCKPCHKPSYAHQVSGYYSKSYLLKSPAEAYVSKGHKKKASTQSNPFDTASALHFPPAFHISNGAFSIHFDLVSSPLHPIHSHSLLSRLRSPEMWPLGTSARLCGEEWDVQR